MTFRLDPGTVIDRFGPWLFALNRNQNLLGKSMLVLDRPCERVVDIEPGEWEALRPAIEVATMSLTRAFAPDHFNYSFLMNVDAQVHLHVMPRYSSPRTWRDVGASRTLTGACRSQHRPGWSQPMNSPR